MHRRLLKRLLMLHLMRLLGRVKVTYRTSHIIRCINGFLIRPLYQFLMCSYWITLEILGLVLLNCLAFLLDLLLIKLLLSFLFNLAIFLFSLSYSLSTIILLWWFFRFVLVWLLLWLLFLFILTKESGIIFFWITCTIIVIFGSLLWIRLITWSVIHSRCWSTTKHAGIRGQWRAWLRLTATWWIIRRQMMSLAHLRWIPVHSISRSRKTIATLSSRWWLWNSRKAIVLRSLVLTKILLTLGSGACALRWMSRSMGHRRLLLISSSSLLMRMTSHLVLLSCSLVGARIGGSLDGLLCETSRRLNNCMHCSIWHALELHIWMSMLLLMKIMLIIRHLMLYLVWLVNIISLRITLLIHVVTLLHLFLFFNVCLFSCPLLLLT